MSIWDDYFDLAGIVVVPGTTVEWVNEGANPHSIVADNGLFDSELLYPGDSSRLPSTGRVRSRTTCRPR